jgi:hypothetical protein
MQAYTESAVDKPISQDAAREMLAALRGTLLLARLKWGNLDDGANEIFARADAAIAKAEG